MLADTNDNSQLLSGGTVTQTKVKLTDIHRLTRQALITHGAVDWVADTVAEAVTQAEAKGNLICGLYYLESYCIQLLTGRVDGKAEPEVTTPKSAAVNVDAKWGFAQAAFERGFETAVATAKSQGICAFSVSHAHTCTSLGFFTEQIARAGLIGIGFTNAPACVAPPGGNGAVLGTNPIAMSIPAEEGGVAFQFDQSTSAVAIGKVRIAAANGESIPLGWAVDQNGTPTTDPNRALDGGALLSSGGYKGYGFGLMAEILAAAVTGSVLSIDAEPLKTPRGGPHNLGQFYFLLDPTVSSGDGFWQRLDSLSEAVSAQPEARLPGTGKDFPDHVYIDQTLWELVLELGSTRVQV